jgi:chromate reductase
MTRILLISGSTSEDSLHSAVLRTAVRHAPADIATDRYDGLRDLPAFVPGERNPPPAVVSLRERVLAADAILFSTPEYAGSLPGSLKNLLDWLVAGGELYGKAAAWLSVTPPGQDEGALVALEAVLGHGNARLLRAGCIRLPLTPSVIDHEGQIGDPQLHLAVVDMLQGLSRWSVTPEQRKTPSWQAYSSVLPVIARRNPSPFRPGS